MKEARARYTKGSLVLLDDLDLEEGKEIVIQVKEEVADANDDDEFARLAGSWKDTLDFDAYLRDLYTNRRSSAPEVSQRLR